MLHAISPSLKKCKRDTCTVNDRVYAPPKRNHLTCSLALLPYPHMKAKGIYLFASTNLRRQYTPIKRGVSHKSPALATSTSWSFTMLTATLHRQRPSSTKPAANLSWPVHKPRSKWERRALSRNTKSWTTKHQQHTRRPLATPIRHTNLFPQTTINATWPKKPSKHSRTTLLVFSVTLPPLSLCTSGANFSRR
jgi:hypothetical protein